MATDSDARESASVGTVNRPVSRSRRKAVVIVLVIAVGAAFTIGRWIRESAKSRPTIIRADYWNAANFTPDAWRAADRRQRRAMVYDLLSRVSRIDMSALEVEADLGPPENKGTEAGEIIWEYDIGDDVCEHRRLMFAFHPKTHALVYVGTQGDDPRSLAVDVRDQASERIRPQQKFAEAVRIFGWPSMWELTQDGLLAEYNVGAARDHAHHHFIVQLREGVVTRVDYWDPNRF